MAVTSCEERPFLRATRAQSETAAWDLRDDILGLIGAQAEVVSDGERERDARRVVSHVDGGTQVLGPGFGVRADVERRRQPPGVSVLVEEAVVAQVVVGVGDEDREDDPSPELA